MVHGEDPYGSLAPAPGLSFANIYSMRDTATIAYLPFWPLITGALYLLFSGIGSGDRFLYYFLLKQPIIFGDVALCYLLFSYVRTARLALNFLTGSVFTSLNIWYLFSILKSKSQCLS